MFLFIYLIPLLVFAASATVAILLVDVYRTAPHSALAMLICAAFFELGGAVLSLGFNFVYFGLGGLRSGIMPATHSQFYQIYQTAAFGGRCAVIVLTAVGTIQLARAYAKLARERRGQP